MCGLHGIITNKKEINADDFVRSAFTANMLRGVDSSGMASIDADSAAYVWHKLPISGNFFIQDRLASNLIRGASAEKTITMCHVRAATVGSVSLDNAHPFAVEYDDGRTVIGTHNGTLTGWQSNKTAKNYTVDSDWAINHIADEGYDAFEDFRGAYCFVWWDSDKHEVLNIARNKERPMFVAMLKSGGMAYASEAGMLYWLLERHNVSMDGPILELEAGYWYKFNINNPKEFDKIELPSSTPSYNYTPSPTPVMRQGFSPYSTMGKVKELIDRAKSAATTTVTPFIGKHHRVSKAEHDKAKELNMLGDVVQFDPYMEWAEGIEGMATVGNAELLAVVRAYDAPYDEGEVWTCRIIGIQDDGEELTLVLDIPSMKDRKKQLVN